LNFKHIKALFLKEVSAELRSKANLGGFVLYLAATIYTCYLSFKKILDVPTWNALFWVIIIFSAINISSRLYQNEARGRKYYLGFLANPLEIYLAKLAFNALFLFLISIVGFLLYSLVLGTHLTSFLPFLSVLLLGSLGFAAILTTVAAIASKGTGSFSLMAVLSFPMLIPFLITLIKFSKNVIDDLNYSLNYTLIIVMLSIIVLQTALSFLLIPYLWRD